MAAAAHDDSKQQQQQQQPPVAKKVKHEMEMFGDVRVDNYYWLRDDSRSNPDVLSYLQQENSYTDFLMSEYLIKKKYCTKEKLCINGRSAGGLLIGAVLNMRPDLFKAAVAGVPFVDVVTTMLDPTIPLTTAEWEEWGDPRKEEFYFYMKSYSPVDNVKAQNYPAILVTAGLNDPRVLYSEPAKFVAKLREMKTDKNVLLFKCEMGAGHFSKSGRFEKLQEDAFTYTFILKIMNMVPALG